MITVGNMARAIEKRLGAPVTMRNCNTIEKVAKILSNI